MKLDFFKKNNDSFSISNNNFNVSDLERNVIIFGGTGIGKTKTIMLPLLEKMMIKGFGGIVVDVKNNFTEDVYRIANKHNKTKKIVEIGSFTSAQNIDLLNGIDTDTLINNIKEVAENALDGKGRISYWTTKGVSILKDVVDVYSLLHKHDILPKLTMYILSKLLVNRKLSSNLYHIFSENSYRYEEEFVELKETIDSKEFHIFHKSNSERLGEQLEWSIGAVSMLLDGFREDRHIERFSNINNDNFSLDFKKLLYEDNKIIVIRFKENTDSNFARIIVNTILKKQKMDIMLSGQDTHTFRMVDEYQNVINAKEDNAWLDKSREFKNIQIFATQSIQSLLSMSDNKDAIYTIIDNCKNKFFFQSNNPTTCQFYEEISILKNYRSLKWLSGDGDDRECIYNNGNIEKKIALNFDFYKKLQNYSYLIQDFKQKEEGSLGIKKHYSYLLNWDKESKSKKKYIEKAIVETGISKPNGIVDDNYLVRFVDKYKMIEKDMKLFIIKEDEKRKVSFAFNDVVINVIKPYKNTTTYDDFIRGFNYKDFDLLEDSIFNIYTYSQFGKLMNSDCRLFVAEKSDESLRNIINIFIIGGDYDLIINHKQKAINLMNSLFSLNSENTINVVGMGHADFIHPINIMADFSYNTPDGVGTRFLTDLVNHTENNIFSMERNFYNYVTDKPCREEFDEEIEEPVKEEVKKKIEEYDDYDLVIALEKIGTRASMEEYGWGDEDKEMEEIYESNEITKHDKEVILNSNKHLDSVLNEFKIEHPKPIFEKIVKYIEDIVKEAEIQKDEINELASVLIKLFTTVGMDIDGWTDEDEGAEELYQDNILVSEDKRIIRERQKELVLQFGIYRSKASSAVYSAMEESINLILEKE